MMFRINSADSNDSYHNGSVRRSTSRGFDKMTPLAPGFIPGDDDVLVGRGKKCLVHTGNLRFKQIVATKLKAYLKAECRVDKTAILMEVIEEVRSHSPNGGFVKQEPKTGRFYEVGDFLAKEKTAQAFRDALHEYYSSSNPSKKKRRVQSTVSPDKKPNTEEGSSAKADSVTSADSTNQTLVHAMHSQFTQIKLAQRNAHSEPSTPVLNHSLVDIQRTHTPPPNFARLVSTDDFAFEPLPLLPEDVDAKRRSCLIMGDTLAFLSSALAENDLFADTAAVNDEIGTEEDPFEPIPLSMCDAMDLV